MALRKKQHDHRWNKKLPIEHTGFYPYLQRYLEGIAIKNYSQETLNRHESHVRRFVVWCEGRNLNEPQSVTKPILERYHTHLYYYRKPDGEPLSFTSQHVMLSSLKSFFKWLTQHNYLLYNPASELELPKTSKKLPRTILTADDIETILNQPDINAPDGLRDRVMMEVLYSSGMRRTELANLSLYDADLKRGVLLIRSGKGNKDRVLPIGERAGMWLQKYIDDVREQLTGPKDENRLFISDYGEPFNGGHLGRIVKRYMQNANINVIGSCHLFRHACATHMLENGADIRFIQILLGHEDITSTEIYTHVSIEKLRAVHKATHPARLKDAAT